MRGLWLRALTFAVLLPGTVDVAVPYALYRRAGGRVDLGPYRLAGAPLLIAGAAVLTWGIWDFARVGRGTLFPLDAPRFVVRTGPYRVVRNPMYIANVAFILGAGLMLESSRVLLWALAAGAAFEAFVRLYEEPAMSRRFGAEYEAYLRSVPRWIPALRRARRARQ
jgi:protein-S-isoprenylcysteine O-methyltransferase Ste14